MKKLFLILVLCLVCGGSAYAFNYLEDFGLGGSLIPESIGALIIILLILYGAFFSDKVTKLIIWGGIMFFISLFTILYFMAPMESILGGFIALICSGGVWYFFAILAEKEKKKESEKRFKDIIDFKKKLKKKSRNKKK